MTKTIRSGMMLTAALLAVGQVVGFLTAQDEKEQPWDSEVRSTLTDALRQLRAVTADQNWADEVQTILSETEKRLKATPSGAIRANDVQGVFAESMTRLKAITATGDARSDEVRTILSEASRRLRTAADATSTTEPGRGEPVTPLAVSAPKITPIRGGYFVEFPRLTEIGAIRLAGPMTGQFELSFDSRLEDVGAEAIPVDNPEFLLVLADYWITRGKPDRAIPLYELGLEKDPNNFLFQNNLAWIVSTALKDHDKALNIIDGALKERSDNVTLLDTKGVILINANRVDEAIPVLQRAVELSCQKPLCVMHYAYALALQGSETAAREWFNKVQPLLETSVNTFLKEDRDMFNHLKSRYTAPPTF